MNIQSRLASLEARMTRRAAGVHTLHGFMDVAAGNPGLGDAMDALADRLHPIGIGDEPDGRTTDELMSDLEILLLENGVTL